MKLRFAGVQDAPSRAAFRGVATRPDGKRKPIAITASVSDMSILGELKNELVAGDEILVTMEPVAENGCAMRLVRFSRVDDA